MPGYPRQLNSLRVTMSKKIITSLVAAVLVCYLYYYFNDRNYAWYTWQTKKHRCQTPEREMNDLVELIHLTHGILKSENITHFLLYGSLWGALRYGKPLPWDTDFDLGVLGDEIENLNEVALFHKFKSKGINIYYRPYLGIFRVTRKSARGDLMIFKDYYRNGLMTRVGLESYLFFINYRNFHRFPAALVERPLPTSKFLGEDFPVPRYGAEIQKYHYRNDYWKESKPSGC